LFEDPGEVKEMVEIVPHAFKFVIANRFSLMKFHDDAYFTQSKILVCADRFPQAICLRRQIGVKI
jgi:hypothetical protein